MAAHIAFLLLTTWLTVSNTEYIPPGPLYACPNESSVIYPCVCEKGTDDGLFIRCENAGLATLSVGLGNIVRLGSPVERMILKECHISRLYGPLFHRSSIRTLHIEDTPLKTIEADAFLGVNSTLQQLFIVNSKLERFPKEAFKVLGNLSILYLDRHDIATLDKDIFSESLAAAKLEKLHIANGNIGEVPVESFQHLKKLKTLDLHGNNISTLKKNQFKGLRDTEVLDLSHNNITKLDASHLGDLTKMGWCNVSSNNIGEITRGMFARNALLKVLHMDNNRLKRLDTNSFRGMRFLRRLYLQDNMISEVGRGTFGSITRIGTIDLARNQLSKVDFQMFYQLNYVEIINLSENNITVIENQSFKDLYQTWINISHNQLANIEPNSFENCGNMTLDLSHNNLTEISKGAFDFNTYALEFQLAYNGFTELNQVPIYNMTGLKVLNVSYNKIHTIPKATFPKLYELHTVDLSHNELTDIASSVFQTLFSLRFLNLSYNHMEVIKPSTFGTLPTVLELDLSHNRLRDVSKGSLAKLASCSRLDLSYNMLDKVFQLPISLGELDLSHNNLSEIKANTWPSMNALLRLNLSYNSLEDNLGTDSFRGLLTLQKLDLSDNGLTKPPWEALSSLSSLQYLHMRNNRLTSLNKAAFGRLPIVFQLDLSDNNITDVSQRAFDGLLQLLDLSLRNNGLEHVPNEAFKGLVSMRTLDLSYNKIEKIDNRTHGLLDDCLSLEKVDLSHNAFSFLTRKMFPSNPYIPYKLYEIDLSYNNMPVLTYDITFGTKKLKRLNLAGNYINDIRKDVVGNLTALEHLDLSKNALKDLTSQTDMLPKLALGTVSKGASYATETVFILPQYIQTLNLADNELEVLPIEQLSKANSLKVLNVTNNKLRTFDIRLVRKIENAGLEVYFEGNKLTCDCFTRPLKHYLHSLPRSVLANEGKYASLRCEEPAGLQNVSFIELDEERLICSNSTEVEDMMESLADATYDLSFEFTDEPDIAFRDLEFTQTSIHMQWYILATGDIADFYVFVRDAKNNIHYSQYVSYALRTLDIVIEENSTLKTTLFAVNDTKSLELCIQAKNSEDYGRKWYASQCEEVPNDFEGLVKTFKLDKGGRGSRGKGSKGWGWGTGWGGTGWGGTGWGGTGWGGSVWGRGNRGGGSSINRGNRSRYSKSSVLRLVSDSILITLCIFLGVCLRKITEFDF